MEKILDKKVTVSQELGGFQASFDLLIDTSLLWKLLLQK